MSVTIPAKLHSHARRDAAAFYLSQLALAVLTGEMSVGTGDDQVALTTPERVLLEIDIKQAKSVNSVAVRLRWPRAAATPSAPAARSTA